MAAKNPESKSGGAASDRPKGHYRAYSKEGKLIWEDPEFIVGSSQIPWGLSISMGAAEITDAKGHRVHTWDPHDILTS